MAGIDPTQVFPRELPDIHQGENFAVYGRFDKPGPFTMRLTGRNGGKLVDLKPIHATWNQGQQRRPPPSA